MIPRLYGAEVKKDVGVSRPETRKKWTEATYFQDAATKLNTEQLKVVKALYNFSKQKADIIRFGTGKDGSFNVVVLRINDKAIYSVYTSGILRLYFSWLHNPDFQQRLKRSLVEKGLFGFPSDFDPLAREYYNTPKDKRVDHLEQFQNIITKLLEH